MCPIPTPKQYRMSSLLLVAHQNLNGKNLLLKTPHTLCVGYYKNQVVLTRMLPTAGCFSVWVPFAKICVLWVSKPWHRMEKQWGEDRHTDSQTKRLGSGGVLLLPQPRTPVCLLGPAQEEGWGSPDRKSLKRAVTGYDHSGEATVARLHTLISHPQTLTWAISVTTVPNSPAGGLALVPWYVHVKTHICSGLPLLPSFEGAV